MGIMCSISKDDVWDICYILLGESTKYCHDQTPVSGGSGDMLCPASFVVHQEDKVLVLIVSSGIMLRAMPNDTMIDRALVNCSSHDTILEIPPLPNRAPEVLKYRYSIAFSLGNYIQHDRPPRTLLASGQTA